MGSKDESVLRTKRIVKNVDERAQGLRDAIIKMLNKKRGERNRMRSDGIEETIGTGATLMCHR